MMRPACGFANCRSRRNASCGDCAAKRHWRRKPYRRPQPQPALDRWHNPFAGRRGVLATAAALCAAVVGIGAAVLPWRAIAPIARPDASVYSAATIARGQQLAALGDCAVCHTGINGLLNAGGRPLETPFGVIYSTNITPDVETGIGAWSYPAFERAMREGIHRDGKQLYPAFPYTHFAKTTDADMQALYAYLMAQSPVRAENRSEQRTRIPVQPASAAGGMERAIPSAKTVPGRCDQIGAVESRRLSGRRPRPLQRLPFAAQRAGRGTAKRLSRRRFRGRLGGTGADVAVAGADPLERGRTLRLPTDRRVPLPRRRGGTDGAGREGTRRPARSGHPRHGGLSRIVQRHRHRQAGTGRPRRQTGSRDQHKDPSRLRASAPGCIEGACAVCHEVGGAPLFGSRPSLALNSNLHSAVPDNLIQVILHGIASPVSSDLGYMPAFRDSLTDGQVAELAAYLRRQFAPDRARMDRYPRNHWANPAGNASLSCHAAGKTHWLGRLRHDRVPPWQ